MARRSGLGRGLSALIPPDAAVAPEDQAIDVAPSGASGATGPMMTEIAVSAVVANWRTLPETRHT